MTSRRKFLCNAAFVPSLFAQTPAGARDAGALDPRGRIHIPIGLPNSLDPLKTFVEAEGNFSPGVGTYGIYFWVFDTDSKRLFAPTMAGVETQRGLAGSGLLLPWCEWDAGGTSLRTELCQVEMASPTGKAQVVAARAVLRNRGTARRKLTLYAALRPLGAAGGNVKRLEVSDDMLVVDGRPALIASRKAADAGVLETDSIGEWALDGRIPTQQNANSIAGDCSGALRFEVVLAPGASDTAEFICPVLPGRRAARHHWVDRKQNAMVDDAILNPPDGGELQPDPGARWYRGRRAGDLFRNAAEYWKEVTARIDVRMPDPRWGESLRAILGHACMCLNEGAPDVAVVNYNVFNRDGMYIANIMQKSGLASLSESILDYFVAHPFNGRAYPESDNPGQILWALHHHWLLTRDHAWLIRMYPSVRQIASLIRYYRTTPGPYWVAMKRLAFGDEVTAGERQELKPGRCDGFHPEYTEAFDVAGLLAAAELAAAAGQQSDAQAWQGLGNELFQAYDRKFGEHLGRQYGSYSVLWPCRLYPAGHGKAWEQFRGIGPQEPKSWRYFPMATAHQGLVAGNRGAGHGTIAIHLAHEQMQGWYAFDEGGGSGSGTWYRTRTRWTHDKQRPGDNRAVAMPHGWAIAEFWLLVRDSIAFEDEGRLVLFAGVPGEWFRAPEGMRVGRLATHFGALDVSWSAQSNGAVMNLSGSAAPPGGFVLRMPAGLAASITRGGERLAVSAEGDCRIPAGPAEIRIDFA